MHRICKQVIAPVLGGMNSGQPLSRFPLYRPMISPDGVPNVIEFNCRCGDPETQPIMFKLRSSLTALCNAVLDGS